MHTANNSSHQPVLELPANLQHNIIDFFASLPDFAHESKQQALIQMAGFDRELRSQIRFNIPLSDFVPRFIETCMNYGELNDGRHALIAALEASQQYIGKDRKAACQSFTQELRDYLNTAPRQSSIPRRDNTTTPQDKPQSGGINISNISGGRIVFAQVSGNMTGDIIAGDKISHETTTYGFKQEADKADFLKQIERLRALLREIRNGFVALDNLDEHQKDAAIQEIGEQIKTLDSVKDAVQETPASQKVPKEKAEIVGSYLDKTTTLMEKLKKMAEATAAASEKIIPGIVNALPLLASLKRLFGLP